jgi:hypothetical protein
MNSNFFIVADRGNLKAYRARKDPAGHKPQMQVPEAVTVVEAHLSASEKFSDEAGRSPHKLARAAARRFKETQVRSRQCSTAAGAGTFLGA